MIFNVQVSSFFKQVQDDICKALEAQDGKAIFVEDLWERDGGGGGRTRIIQEGNIIEKGGVNFSEVHGELSEKMQKALNIDSKYFYATGVSIVIHPISPMIPIIHMNVRYFETKNSKEDTVVDKSWFGGGIDLTPHYVVEEDAYWFHEQLKACCDVHDLNYYSEFKTWADDYFYIKHREETRGVGGIFFDRQKPNDKRSIEDLFEFVKDVANTFAPTYVRLMEKGKDVPYEDQHKKWQGLRRGRYVEFNLVLDSGTKFGLETNGRTESILMSLPKNASWEYCAKIEKGSAEEKTLSFLKKGIDWC